MARRRKEDAFSNRCCSTNVFLRGGEWKIRASEFFS